MANTVRDRVKLAQRVLAHGTPELAQARDIYAELTALLGNCQDELRAAESEYTAHLLVCLNEHGKANRAEIVSKTGPQWARKREAEDVLTLAERMVKTLDNLIRSMAAEWKATQHGPRTAA